MMYKQKEGYARHRKSRSECPEKQKRQSVHCPHMCRFNSISTARSTLNPSPKSVFLNASFASSAVKPISTIR